VNQDYCCQREKTVGIPEPRKMELSESTYMTPKEKEIITLLGKNLTRDDICQLLNITRNALRQRLNRIRKKRNAFNI